MSCATLWIGDSLGPVERACLRSVVRQGHQLTLYCYRQPAGVPEEVTLDDAGAILPESSIFYHRKGSVALFADWFRYELQRRRAGIWVDTDVYLLRPLDERREYLFGGQAAGLINDAIRRLPAEWPAIDDLLKPFAGKTPPWLRGRSLLMSKLREMLTGRADVASMPWGSTGPAALTAVVNAHGVQCEALPPDVFYPAPWESAAWILDPDLSLDDMISEATVAIHLWNEQIKHFKNTPAPPGSFLRRLHQEGAE